MVSRPSQHTNADSKVCWRCTAVFSAYSIYSLQQTTRLNRSPWIIQKEIFKMSDRISYIYMAELQYKSQNLHHNKNLRKGINGTDKYAVKQLPSLILGAYMCHWLGSAFLLPKLASTTKKHRKQSVLLCSTFSHTTFGSASYWPWTCTWTACRKWFQKGDSPLLPPLLFASR